MLYVRARTMRLPSGNLFVHILDLESAATDEVPATTMRPVLHLSPDVHISVEFGN